MTDVLERSAAAAWRESLARVCAAMPPFATLVTDLARTQPLRGARIACTLPLGVGAIVVAESLLELGATVRWAPAGGGAIDAGLPIDADLAESTALRGLTLLTRPTGAQGRRNILESLLNWPGGLAPNLLLEWDADISRLIHVGTRLEGRRSVEQTAARLSLPAGALPLSAVAMEIGGTTETTPRGARWFSRHSARNTLLYPAMDCSEAQEFSNLTHGDRGSRHSAACALLILSQVDLFQRRDSAAALSDPPAKLTRTVSAAHDIWLRRQIEKLPDPLAYGQSARAVGSAS